MEDDLDPNIGSRTRTLLGGVFGLGFTVGPLAGWAYASRTGRLSYFDASVLPAVVFFVLGVGAFLWARDTMTRTSLNRRLGQTFALYMAVQAILGTGGWLAGVSATHLHLFFLVLWSLTYGMLAVWAERWLALPAAGCAASFLVASAYPWLTYPLMSFCNLLFTVVLVKVWFPRQDIARMQERRRELRARARGWLIGERSGGPE
jgi:hypothetical protein